MKKLYRIIVAIILSLSFGLPAIVAESAFKVEEHSFKLNMKVNAIHADSFGYYFAQDNKLFFQLGEDTSPSLVLESDNKILALHSDENQLAVLTQESIYILQKTNFEQSFYTKIGDLTISNLEILQLCVWNKHLYLLAEEGDSHHHEAAHIYILDIATKDIKTIEIAGMNKLFSAIDINADILYLYDRAGLTIERIDLNNNKMLPSISSSGLEFGEVKRMRIKDGSAYFLTNSGSLFKFLLNSLNLQSLRLAPQGYGTDDFLELFLLDGKAYILQKSTDTVIKLPLKFNEEKTISLNLGSGLETLPDYFFDALSKVKQEYPDFELGLSPVSDSLTFTVELLAGDLNIDIFSHQRNTSFHPLWVYKAGGLHSFTDDMEFKKILSQFKGAEELCTFEGQLLGFPTLIIPVTMAINRELLNQIGLDEPSDNWLWDELFAMGDKVLEYNKANGTNYKLIADELLFPYFMDQYIASHMEILNGKLELDTDEFKNMISSWKKLKDAGLIYDVGVRGEGGLSLRNSVFAMIEFDSTYKFYYEAISPPKACEHCKYPINVVTYLLYSRAEPKEASVSYFRALAEESLKQMKNNMEQSESTVKAINSVMANPINYAIQRDLYRAVRKENFIPYMNNEIDLETCIKQSQEAVNLIMGE